MPGWYIHMEAAKQAVDRLQAGRLPPDFPSDVDAKALGDIAHKWRNYLALGAIGPDIFALLPDFRPPAGSIIANTLDWYIQVFEVLDTRLIGPWETYAQPAIDGVGDILNNVTGDTLKEIGQALEEFSKAIQDAFVDLLAHMEDWFSLLQSGVPQGVEESLFTWFDMFHYRRTYAFPRRLLERAAQHPTKSEQFTAFAIGWMSHCATDVTGHSFVNAKCGGPYRLHWQRHHLIENHMDSLVYHSQHQGSEPYGEIDTAALHFRLAFRRRDEAPYNGAEDAPAYDYFDPSGRPGPAYDPSPAGDFVREHLWDLDSGDMPADLCQFLIDTMREIYPDPLPGGDANNRNAPKILTDVQGNFTDHGRGRPNVKTLQDTFFALYHYLKTSSTSGYLPPRPTPPTLFNDHTPPPAPGFNGGVNDDPTRGADADDERRTLLDDILSVLAAIAYALEYATWLITLPADVVADILTYPAREVLYNTAVIPLWNLYMTARKPLVMTGFLHPKPEEISPGLVRLGVSAVGPPSSLLAALAAPNPSPPATARFDEPSGRRSATSAFGADPAYPRQTIKDTLPKIQELAGYVNQNLPCNQDAQPSEFLAPWRYPNTNLSGKRNGWEAGLSHPGPFLQGQDARVLMNGMPGNTAARQAFEAASTPEQTEQTADAHLPAGRHLGDAVDYSVYLIGRLAHGDTVPDFNMDADRGYGYHTWEWDRDPSKNIHPNVGDSFPGPTPGPPPPTTKYDFHPPCTAPQGYCQPQTPDLKYNPTLHLSIHYGEAAVDACQPPVPVTPVERRQARMDPASEI